MSHYTNFGRVDYSLDEREIPSIFEQLTTIVAGLIDELTGKLT